MGGTRGIQESEVTAAGSPKWHTCWFIRSTAALSLFENKVRDGMVKEIWWRVVGCRQQRDKERKWMSNAAINKCGVGLPAFLGGRNQWGGY
jgi:hypothetical protein